MPGLRKLSARRKVMETALTTLKGRARVKRTMWSRRAQEYEAKINSGDPVSIAEVVRDLHRERRPARPVLQRAPDLRGGARSPGARTGGGRAHRQGNAATAAAGAGAEGGVTASVGRLFRSTTLLIVLWRAWLPWQLRPPELFPGTGAIGGQFKI